MSKAMGLAGKIYKSHSTPAQIRDLNDFTLQDCGITDSSDRKQVLAAFRKAGFTPIPVKPKRGTASKRARDSDGAEDSSPSTTSPSKSAGKSFSSGSPAVDAIITPPKRKRTKIVKNEFLPDGPQEEGSTLGSLEFNEVSDEAVLSSKFVVINRAPVMTAWAMVVAETMNFKREEALSIASVYTEMNAISRGVSIGLYKSGKDRGMEVSRSGSQPFVELMGRRSVRLFHSVPTSANLL
ncbi:hypothetical protein CC2G_010476 [Coprinopsis cinerea AmutBmut pab1-1]|nr:hypothetical protein CC2G_010476 [Coprinopsis cinerea AmutBmut pab1-1]